MGQTSFYLSRQLISDDCDVSYVSRAPADLQSGLDGEKAGNRFEMVRHWYSEDVMCEQLH